MINPVIVFGAGYLGRLALDAFHSNGIIIYGFLDDQKDLHGTEIGEMVIFSHTEDDGYLKLIGKKCDAFVAAENPKERAFLWEMLRERRSVVPVNAIHREASFSPHAHAGHGNLISAGARVAGFAHIGDGNVLHPNAVVETGARLGDGIRVGSGSVIGHGATIGDNAFIGAGVTVLEGIKIGKNASVGAGSVVLADVAAGSRVFGYPAAKVGS